MQIPRTRERALRLARSLQKIVKRDHGVEVKLSLCQTAIAVGFGRANWHDFELQLDSRGAAGVSDGARAAAKLGLDPVQMFEALATLERLAAPKESPGRPSGFGPGQCRMN